jgi:PAS domain S-box-containing protein
MSTTMNTTTAAPGLHHTTSRSTRPGGRDAHLPVVLVVDDVPDNLLALEGMLRRADIEIVTATSGREALEALLEREVAVAIIDVMMPEMDGFELAELIRGAARTRHVPIIFVTAASKAEYRAFAGYELGAIDFLFKPLNDHVLRAKVDVLVTLDRQQREAERARAETEVLLNLAQAIGQAYKPADIYDPALNAVRELLGADRSAILLFDETDRMRFHAWRGLSDSYRSAVDGHSPWSRDEKNPTPLLISDVTTANAMATYQSVFAAEGVSAIGFVPLVTTALIGKFMLYWDRPRTFSEHDGAIARSVASQVAQALERARLQEEERRAHERRAAIQLISDAALASLDVDPLLAEMLARVRRIFSCDTATILLLNAKRTHLEVRASDGIEAEAWGDVAVPYGVGVTGRIVAEERPLVIDDMATADVVSPILKARLRSLAGVPLVVDKHPIGVLHIGTSQLWKFTEADVELLEMVAARAASALDRSSAYEALRTAEEKLRVALSAGQMGVWEWSLPTGRVAWSPTLEMIHGLKPGAFPGTFEAYESDIHPDDKVQLRRTVQETLAAGREHHVEYRIVLPDGRMRWVAGHGNVVSRMDGKPVTMMGVCMDITDRKKAEEVQGRFVRMLDSAFDAIILRDEEDRVTSWNSGATELYGWMRDEALGQVTHSLFKTKFPEPLDHILAKVRRDHRWEGELVHTRKDGVVISVFSRWVLEQHADGPGMAILETNTDITERKRAEQSLIDSEARYRTLFEVSVYGVITIDEDGTIETANPAAERIFGYPATELAGRNVNTLMPEPYTSQHDSYLRNYQRTGERKIIGIGREVVGRRKDGSEFPMDLAVSEFRVAGKRYFKGLVNDITQRKELERAREAAVAELKQTLHDNEIFAGVLAHDLRNPLNAMQTATQLVLHREQGKADLTPLRRAVSSGERMARLIDQLLDFTKARIGGGFKLQPREADLSRLCAQALSELELANPGWKVKIESLGELSGTWDTDRILQMVSNLVTNAGQHGTVGDEIQIRLDGTAPDAVVFQVQNNGSIPEALLPHLFAPFRGTRELKSGSSGLGLGIYITREIVRSHGGTIEVASSEAAGTTVTVMLPRHALQPSQAHIHESLSEKHPAAREEGSSRGG